MIPQEGMEANQEFIHFMVQKIAVEMRNDQILKGTAVKFKSFGLGSQIQIFWSWQYSMTIRRKQQSCQENMTHGKICCHL